MKVKTPFSGFEAEFHVFANDQECDEFMLLNRPTDNNDKQPIKESYVAVSDDQTITIAGHLTGRLSRARFDLIVDGSFAGTRQVEPDKDGQAKQHNRRRIEFRSINTVLGVDGGSKVVDGELTTQRLGEQTEELHLNGMGSSWGVGSLVIIISVEESYSTEGYLPDRRDYPDRVFRNWEYREEPAEDPGVPPTHCMTLRHVNYNVIPQKCNKFYNQFEGTRFGTKAVAKLVFYYRSRSAIHARGCMPCPKRAYPIEEEFEEQSPIRTDPSSPPTAMEEDTSTSLFLASPNTKTQQKRKLGGTLVLPKNESNRAKDFYELVQEQELERQESSSNIRSRERQGSVFVDDSASAAIAASRTILIGGNPYTMLSLRSINDIMLKEGIPLTQMLRFAFPGLPKEDRSEAANVLVKHMQDFVVVRTNEAGRHICIRIEDLPEESTPSRRRDKRLRLLSPIRESPSKRTRNITAPPTLQKDLTTSHATLQRKAVLQAQQRLAALEEKQKRIAEEAAREAAVLAELEDEQAVEATYYSDDVAHETIEEGVGGDKAQDDAAAGEFDPQAIGYYEDQDVEGDLADADDEADADESAEGESGDETYQP